MAARFPVSCLMWGEDDPKQSLIKCLREKMFCHESAPSIYKALTVQERNTLDHC